MKTFSNICGKELFDCATQWKNDAIKDEWIPTKTYESESIDRACTLNHPSGFTALIVTRYDENKVHPYEVFISVWGPDRLGIQLERPEYDMNYLQEMSRVCMYCGKTNCDTFRVGFAGRACKECRKIEEGKLPRNFYD